MEEQQTRPRIPPLLRQSGPAVWHLGPDRSAGADVGPRILIGGVGYWWQRDASIGLEAIDALEAQGWPPGVRLAKLDYGAIYVAEDLRSVSPAYDALLLIAGIERGRPPGRLYASRWAAELPDEQEIQARVYESGAGVVDLDHLLVIGQYFGALPDDVRLFEVEPVDASGGEGLSPKVTDVLPDVIARVRREVRGILTEHDDS